MVVVKNGNKKMMVRKPRSELRISKIDQCAVCMQTVTPYFVLSKCHKWT